MPFWMLKWRSQHKNVQFYSVLDGDVMVGMVHLVSDGKTAYLLYFAVAEGCRSRGYGSRILDLLKARLAGQSLLLCVEPLDPDAPNYPQRLRRMQFYTRNGFRETGYQAKEGTVIFDMLAYGPPVQKESYVRLMRGFIGWPLRLLFHPQAFDKT